MMPSVREPPPGELGRPLASSPGGGRHSGPQGRGPLIAVRLHGAQAWGPQRCERYLPFQCTDHAELWDSRREGTTSELGVLPAARLRRAVPTGGRRSLACASLRLVAWAPCAMFSVGVAPSATRRALLRAAVPARGRHSKLSPRSTRIRDARRACAPSRTTALPAYKGRTPGPDGPGVPAGSSNDDPLSESARSRYRATGKVAEAGVVRRG